MRTGVSDVVVIVGVVSPVVIRVLLSYTVGMVGSFDKSTEVASISVAVVVVVVESV